ncbi:MAG TPA: IS1 family transposase [Gemmatimonadaceae bacterium]|nr:IS1 family transposase [Gemmatimonadaceae bacterium]
MNILPRDTQAAILRALVEGNSMRATARLCGVSRNTVASLLKIVGAHCKNHHDRFVVNVNASRIQADEIWSFVGSKEKNTTPERKAKGDGDCWTWVALDPDSKLVVSYRVGTRDGSVAYAFMQDLADRLTNRVQLTTDALNQYLGAVESAFGWNGVDYARLIKIFGASTVALGKYSPAKLVRTEKHWVMGTPDAAHVSTSLVERQNMTMRMQMRRFTRLTNAFSKKVEFHLYAVALHYTYYNYCRPHTTLNRSHGRPTTPAMAAGLAEKPWSIDDLLNLLHGN